MSLEDINKIINNETSDREYRQKIKILKYVYTMLLDDGDLNKTSMILYSGPQEDRPCYNFLSLQPAFSLFPRRSCLFDTFYNKEKTSYYGCLYTGDVDLTEIDIIRDIESRLNEAGVLSYIGTLQIPHHGSKHKVVSLKVCNSSFFSLFFHCFFILFFPAFELIYSPAICRLCFLHRHGCQ